VRPLDPLSIPLHGLHLIEASAGTGKTFTITLLYLRLLLEAGLAVDRILVVTFTNAATEELRDRIRSRLRAALGWLEGERDPKRNPVDGPLLDLLLHLPDPQRAARILGDSLTRLDESAIHTIHGFCQRMLEEHAFESGMPFEAELTGDASELFVAVMTDFWRRHIATLGAEDARWVGKQFASPADLLKTARRILSVEPSGLIPPTSAERTAEARERRESLFGQLQTLWAEERGAVVALLERHLGLNRHSYNSRVVTNAIEAMDRLSEGFDTDRISSNEIGRFLPETLAERLKTGSPPAHPLFPLVKELKEATLAAEEIRRAWLLRQARDFLEAELARRKAERRQLTYDDLLSHLARGLEGERCESFAQRIRERFPAALIDEFQDTDPLQYRIFRHLYRAQPDCALFLIGDPKQAIYAFRGADIFTYMQARRDVAREGQEHTLLTNRRSSSALIRAVNTLFGTQEVEPFVYRDIPFVPAAPGPEADDEPLTLDGVSPPPLELGWLVAEGDKGLSRDAAGELGANACAARISELLRLADQGRVLIGDRPLRAGDIAVLVRTHFEGDRVQRALRAAGVRSASLSREGVFATQEAADLALVLAAVAEPAREGLVRAALASPLIGTSAAELDALGRNDATWEQQLERFRGYRQQWLEGGFLVAFLRLLHDHAVPARLLGQRDGERRMTNLLQLGELLQMATAAHPRIEALLSWMADGRAKAVADETEELRLESDENLVQILTQHKSKGLEYSVVFIPSPWSHTSPEKDKILTFHDPLTHLPAAYLGATERGDYLPRVREEQLAEQLRLLYVSVTRAKKLCVLYWGAVKGAEGCALAYLIHPDPEAGIPASRMQGLSSEGIRADLQRLVARSAGSIAVHDIGQVEPSRLWRPNPDSTRLSAPPFHVQINSEWRVVSYSGLVSGRESETPDYDAATADRGAEPPVETTDPAFQFPRGTGAGHCLHGLLEQIDFPSADRGSLTPLADGLLERFGLERRWSGVAAELVLAALDTPLDETGDLRLRQIQRGDCLRELEFHYPLGRLDPQNLSGSLAGFKRYRHTGRGLNFQPTEGLMRGFIDLVFRHDGRYFLADYKSNHLGDRLPDYGTEGLARAITGHRYDLQYLVYSLALHRYLGRRLRNYHYQHHFGGVYYLFLRGMRPAEGSRFGVFFDRPEQRVIEALDALFAAGGRAP